ncbi:MAG: SDR family oxidoreductase [Limnobacter sp.]|uniref:SDR family oxidoreductase n=1 Tax=Limnobacter sp. TaxID=2003368 RepID=UPI0022C676C9|nr:SDR family oxidoreductase [Limnobacter sp.]MCZ8014578.1 SDR family oxidoreductase [Limnobacter sp.]
MIKAVLTGHSKGLGLGIAQSLLARGYPVLGLSRSIHAELQKQFPTLLQQLPVDLAEHAALQELLVGEALPEFMANATQLLLINNAGLVSPIGPLSVQPASDISRSMQLNVTTPLVLSAHITQLLKVDQQLRVLHVSSGAGRSAYPGWSVYCASKAALDMHAQATQLDKLEQVRICSLAPGVIDTDMQAQILDTDEALFPNKKRFEELKSTQQLSSPKQTGERLVDYLLSPKFGSLAVDDLRSH